MLLALELVCHRNTRSFALLVASIPGSLVPAEAWYRVFVPVVGCVFPRYDLPHAELAVEMSGPGGVDAALNWLAVNDTAPIYNKPPPQPKLIPKRTPSPAPEIEQAKASPSSSVTVASGIVAGTTPMPAQPRPATAPSPPAPPQPAVAPIVLSSAGAAPVPMKVPEKQPPRPEPASAPANPKSKPQRLQQPHATAELVPELIVSPVSKVGFQCLMDRLGLIVEAGVVCAPTG